MSKQDLFAYIILALFGIFLVLMIVPGTLIIYAERQFAETLVHQNDAGAFKGMGDLEIRRQMQKLAREQGFNLSTNDVIVQLKQTQTPSPQPSIQSEAPKSVPNFVSTDVEKKGRIGYTLVILVPVMWLFDFELVAVRDVELKS